MMEESIVVIVRTIIAFGTLLIYTRLLGKQQMGNLTYFDYITGITIGNMAGALATDINAKAIIHWLGLTIFVIITMVIQFIDIKSRFISKVIDSEPVVLMQNGKILESNMRKVKMTYDSLMVLLRQKNIFDITQVEYAIFEPDGNISVLPKAEYQAVTPYDMNIPVQPAGLTTEVIMDGIILQQNLKQRQKDKQWLDLQLLGKGIGDLKEVSFAAILPNGQLYVDRFEDHVGKKADISDYKGPY